jgi:tRNA A-37 threonylcarbamoyl transferase component Bud32
VYAGILHPALVPASASTSDGRKEQSGERVFLKHRFKKTYRHTALDTQLTKARISAEARSLARCARCVFALRPPLAWICVRFYPEHRSLATISISLVHILS